MEEKLKFRITLAKKRMRDMKLKTKIRVALFVITILTILAIGLFSYQVARRELLRNAEEAVLNLQEQGGHSLDSRINTFEDASFQILQASNIEEILGYTAEQAAARRVMNEGLPTVLTYHSILMDHIRYALLRPKSGRVYSYYRSREKKLGTEQEHRLLDALDRMVDLHHIKKWVNYAGKIYFIRQVVTPDLEENGIMCFAVDESFWHFLGEELKYISDDKMLIFNQQGEYLYGTDSPEQTLLEEDITTNEYQGYGFAHQYQKEWNHDTMAVTVIRTEIKGWTLVSYYYYSELLGGIRTIIRGILWSILAVGLLILIITGAISTTITKNVRVIETGMHHYEEGDFDYRIRPESCDEVGLLGLQLNYMALRLQELIDMLKLREEEKKRLEIETLQAQINPHFLYNTLGSLKWSAFRNGQKELAASLDALIQLLRFTIKKANSMVTIEEETAYVKNYVAIEKMRYGNSFRTEYQIDESIKQMEIPGFLLQPLVENSIIHGLDQTKPDGRIDIRAWQKDNYLYIEVEDNGMGIPKEKLLTLIWTCRS